MFFRRYLLSCVFSLLFVAQAAGQTQGKQNSEQLSVVENWENIELKRIVDVSRVYTIETVELKIRNVAKKAQSEYYVAFPKHIIDKASMFTATLSEQNMFIDSAILTDTTVIDGDVVVGYGLIKFPTPIEPGEETSLTTRIFYNEATIPYPEHIAIADVQQLMLETNRLPLSAYKTKKATLKFVGSNSFSEWHPSEDSNLRGEVTEKGIQFGPWNNVDNYAVGTTVNILFEHNRPLNQVCQLNRDVWISHWASTIQFEEYFEFTNRGAKLDKGFSRMELMKTQQKTLAGHHNAIIDAILPEGASDEYYTDLVGMVSTAQLQDNHYYLKPRYPLFGGWKYNFTIGWTNKLSQFLHKSSNNSYLVAVPLLDGQLDTEYANLKVSVFLPEGAIIEEVDPPLALTDFNITEKKSYFDLGKGHTEVVLKFRNIVDEIGKAQIFIKYRYDSASFYKKPLSIATYIFVALMSVFWLKTLNLRVEAK